MSKKTKKTKALKQAEAKKTKNVFLLMVLSVIFGIFYIVWRAVYTVNYWGGDFVTFWSLILLGAEIYSLLIFISFAVAVNKSVKKDLSEKVKPFYYMDKWPTVDIFITTYNESVDMVKDTTSACINVDYPNKKVFILDDGKRQEMKELSERLGCLYITRDNNKGFKAGNVNNALKQTDGEIIVIFDADHVPVSTFLKETVGFFENPRLALLQTPQHFLNLDPFQKNLNLEKYISNEQELFYRIIEPGLADYEATICGGTNFLLRRKHVEEAGYFSENTITEDFAMSLKLQCMGLKVAYFNKPLATGRSVETFAEYIKQRTRWAKGNIQALLDPENIFNLFKLKPIQFFFNFMGAFYFLYCFPRIIFIISPVLFILFGCMPVKAIIYQIITFQVVYFALKVLFFNVTAGKYRHFLFTDVYESATSLFMSVDLARMFLIPKLIEKQKFLVTNKSNIKYNIDYSHFIALFILALFVFLSIAKGTYDIRFVHGSDWAAILVNVLWSVYNFGVIVFALRVTLNKPEVRKHVRIPVKTKVKLHNSKGYVHILSTINISKFGALLTYDKELPISFFEDCFLVFPGCSGKHKKGDDSNCYEKAASGLLKTYLPENASGYRVELVDTYRKDDAHFFRIKLYSCTDEHCPVYKSCLLENMFLNSNNWDW